MGGVAVARSPRPPSPQPGIRERAADLGFDAFPTLHGPVYRRCEVVDLRDWLRRADVDDPVRAHQLASLDRRARISERSDLCLHDTAEAPVAVMDIESTGLRGSGVVAFLVGIAVQRGATLAVEQYLLADVDAEAALLDRAAAALAEAEVVITYNGRTFDVPVLTSRAVINRLDVDAFADLTHCDLLPAVRRLFRDRLGACTLRRAEVELLRMHRHDDVPGSEGPARYHAWRRGASRDVLAGVIHHNTLDLCATALLAARLIAHVRGNRVKPAHPADAYLLACHLTRGGDQAQAEELLREAMVRGVAPWDRRAGHLLARLLGRRDQCPRRGAQAEAILGELWRRPPGDLVAARALAVRLERRGAVTEAVRLCDRALELARDEHRQGQRRVGEPRHGWVADWSARRLRLVRRIEVQQRRRPCARVSP